TKTSDKKVKSTAIVSVSNAGVKTTIMYTGQAAAAPVAGATYSKFGLPSTATGTSRFVVKATLAGHPGSTNSALIYSFSGGASNAFAQKGVATGVSGLPPAVTYSDYTDPIVNGNTQV